MYVLSQHTDASNVVNMMNSTVWHGLSKYSCVVTGTAISLMAYC